MDVNFLIELVRLKYSIYSIGKIMGYSPSTIRYWLRKYELKTYRAEKEKQTEEERKAKNVIYVGRRRKELKKKSVEYKGGKCEVCGYSKCIDALDFHHQESSIKEFGISQKGYTRSWEKVKEELNKCILLCANCHRERHSNCDCA